MRRRKTGKRGVPVPITLSQEAVAALDDLASSYGRLGRSIVIGELIMAEYHRELPDLPMRHKPELLPSVSDDDFDPDDPDDPRRRLKKQPA